MTQRYFAPLYRTSSPFLYGTNSEDHTDICATERIMAAEVVMGVVVLVILFFDDLNELIFVVVVVVVVVVD